MPKDAKFGLVLGVALVVLIAALFFHRSQDRTTQPPNPAVSYRPIAQSTVEPTAKTPAKTAPVKQEGGANAVSMFSLASVSE